MHIFTVDTRCWYVWLLSVTRRTYQRGSGWKTNQERGQGNEL